MKWASYVGVCVGVWTCVVNIVNTAVDWPSLLHTLSEHDLSWSG